MRHAPLVCLFGSLVLAACGGFTPDPARSRADLQQILSDCWHVSQMQEIDAAKAEHIAAFTCARERLEKVAQSDPKLPEVHRVLAWGLYYQQHDVIAALAEYDQAARLYHESGQTVEEADIYRRMGVLAMTQDKGRGCFYLLQSQAVSPNPQAAQALANYGCPAPVPSTLAAPAPSPTSRK